LWYNKELQQKDNINFDDDKIYEEFLYLKEMLKKNGYIRYEISNFALP
jgi:coproporphyrinogen III oxidase-like Fe-S oxidoreductase